MSTLLFNANEILEIAKRIERRGMAFYQAAAELMTEIDTKRLMLELVEAEKLHEATFAHMQKHLSDAEKSETLEDPHGTAADFLGGMADGYVFDLNADPVAFLGEKPGVKAILCEAIDREAASIAFYTCVRPMISVKHGQGRIEEIIAQEMGHIAQLSKELKKYQ